MRAAVMREGAIVVDTLPDPSPGDGQVLVKTLACGICGSDLHALTHGEEMKAAGEEAGIPASFDPSTDLVMGHEFCAEILDFGPNTLRRLGVGDRVCSMPILVHPGGLAPVGYSNAFPGGYGERMLLSEPLLLPVPEDLPTEVAALTEPMAVGIHAVARARLQPNEAPLVVGCGPVGLAVVAALSLADVHPIVAADYSPRRRELAVRLGADAVVDPAREPAVAAWQGHVGARSAVVFECVGVPGLLAEIMREAPPQARLVVAGVCMEEDRIRPMIGIYKELQIQFVLGYTPEEFKGALDALADGRIEGAPLVTGRVGVEGVAGAFQSLGQPEKLAKILVEPWRAS